MPYVKDGIEKERKKKLGNQCRKGKYVDQDLVLDPVHVYSEANPTELNGIYFSSIHVYRIAAPTLMLFLLSLLRIQKHIMLGRANALPLTNI